MSLLIRARSPTLQYRQKQIVQSNGPSSTAMPYNAHKSFGNMIPAKVEVRLGSSAPNGLHYNQPSSFNNNNNNASSKPIDILPSSRFNGNGVGGGGTSATAVASGGSNGTPSTTPYKGGAPSSNKKRAIENRQTVAYAKNAAFGTPVDDPAINEEFDFEKNLALFDKQAIWNEIDAIQKPDLMRQTAMVKKQNYRHDENVLTSAPTTMTGLRQITLPGHATALEYATDDGLIIPAIPLATRWAVQKRAEQEGLSWLRQCDMLARGTAELSLMLLGGARRLTQKNQHQWPVIVIVCDEPLNERISEIGLATGRQLASHGLKVCFYSSAGGTQIRSERQSAELSLFMANDFNRYTTSINGEDSEYYNTNHFLSFFCFV